LWVLRSARQGAPNSFDGYGFVAFFMLEIGALLTLAAGLRQAGGPWAVAGIIAINTLIQHVSLYLFAGAAYKLGMAFTGRVVCAWRVVPRGEVPAVDYRALRWYCLSQGVAGCLFASGLGWSCLQLLL
jgi:hypothetical protein